MENFFFPKPMGGLTPETTPLAMPLKSLFNLSIVRIFFTFQQVVCTSKRIYAELPKNVYGTPNMLLTLTVSLKSIY